jgi:hypothetical protein
VPNIFQSAGRLSGNETVPPSKKEVNTSSAKRAKVSANVAIGPMLSNQSPAAEMKPPQAETVDIHGHFMKAKLPEYEMYGGNGSQITNDIHYDNPQKEGGTKKMAMTDGLDLYVENIPSKKSVRGANSKMETEDTMCQSSSILGLPLSIDNSASTGTKVKIEREQHNSEGTGHARVSPDLASVLKRAAGIEDMELGNSENSAVQGECLYLCYGFVFILLCGHCRSVGIVRSRTQATEFSLVLCGSDYTEGFGLEIECTGH